MTASWNRTEQVDVGHSLASNSTVVCCTVNKNLEYCSLTTQVRQLASLFTSCAHNHHTGLHNVLLQSHRPTF